MWMCLEELVTIPADGTSLNGQLAYSAAGRTPCALIAGSHPLLGGNMNSNVASSLRTGLAERNAAALSFDYRNPRSPGTSSADWARTVSEFWRTNHVPQEADWRNDTRSALAYLRSIAAAPTVLIGYSFGCHTIAGVAADSQAAAVICISPNPRDNDLSLFQSLQTPLLVISSDNDFSCTAGDLRLWYDSLGGPREIEIFSKAEHFFRGRERDLVCTVSRFLLAHGLIEE
ncbi:MAG: dienelactone hydrolase family protein [Planctomycetes bacterium]|nr:dienelactone hydrolase family protein [Planctomycetota bacterium]